MDWRFFRSKTPAMLGVDISSSAVKLLELSKTLEGYRVESYAVEPFAREAINESEIKDVEAIGKAIQIAVKRCRTRTQYGAIAVSGSGVITKIIQMNAALSDHEMADQIAVEADRYIPYPLQEVNLDFQVLGISKKNPALVDVLLAASRSENVDTRVEVLGLGGLTAKVIDIEAFAIERAFSLLADQLPKEIANQTVALVDIGSNVSTFNVLHNRSIVHTREQLFGGYQLTEEIQRRYGLSYEEAGLAKKQGGLPEDYVSTILEPFKESVVQQVSRALQFFFSSSEYSEIHYLILAGGTTAIQGLGLFLEERLKIPTMIADPFVNMTLSPKVSVPAIKADASSLLICCGLAMRSFVS